VPAERSSRTKWAVALAGVVVVIVAFVLLRGGDDTSSGDRAATTSTATAPTQAAAPSVAIVTVVGGKPKGGVQKIAVAKGDPVRLRIVADTADEVHVHGYDLKKDVAAGGRVTFAFPATIDGRFVIELESSGTQLAELDVEP
jgi:hypothetical protein